MNAINSSSMPKPSFEAIGDELDRLEIIAGKIGMNSSAQALALLHGLD